MKIYCASDLHLGYERTNYDAIGAFFDLVKSEADELVLCGDTFDLWRYPVDKIGKSTLPGFNKCLKKLEDLGDIVPITVIPGNHDYALKTVWKDAGKYNLEIKDEYIRENIYYTHGWKFDVQQRKYSWAFGWLVTQYPYLYQRYFRKPSSMGLTLNDAGMPEAKLAIRKAANDFAIKRGYTRIVIGHTHIPGIQGRVIDCGDFVDSCSYYIIENGVPELKYI